MAFLIIQRSVFARKDERSSRAYTTRYKLTRIRFSLVLTYYAAGHSSELGGA